MEDLARDVAIDNAIEHQVGLLRQLPNLSQRRAVKVHMPAKVLVTGVCICICRRASQQQCSGLAVGSSGECSESIS